MTTLNEVKLAVKVAADITADLGPTVGSPEWMMENAVALAEDDALTSEEFNNIYQNATVDDLEPTGFEARCQVVTFAKPTNEVKAKDHTTEYMIMEAKKLTLEELEAKLEVSLHLLSSPAGYGSPNACGLTVEDMASEWRYAEVIRAAITNLTLNTPEETYNTATNKMENEMKTFNENNSTVASNVTTIADAVRKLIKTKVNEYNNAASIIGNSGFHHSTGAYMCKLVKEYYSTYTFADNTRLSLRMYEGSWVYSLIDDVIDNEYLAARKELYNEIDEVISKLGAGGEVTKIGSAPEVKPAKAKTQTEAEQMKAALDPGYRSAHQTERALNMQGYKHRTMSGNLSWYHYYDGSVLVLNTNLGDKCLITISKEHAPKITVTKTKKTLMERYRSVALKLDL